MKMRMRKKKKETKRKRRKKQSLRYLLVKTDCLYFGMRMKMNQTLREMKKLQKN